MYIEKRRQPLNFFSFFFYLIVRLHTKRRFDAVVLENATLNKYYASDDDSASSDKSNVSSLESPWAQS